LVQNKIFSLPNSNPSLLDFDLDSLQVGDKIKLRATITDTSIYNNVSHYPDTGWVVMNILSPVVNVENENVPATFNLSQNYPNPFNPVTSLQYAIGSRQFVTLKVYDLLGREVETLVNEEKPAGEYEVEFNAANLLPKGSLTSGIYFYQLKAGSFAETRKMVLIK